MRVVPKMGVKVMKRTIPSKSQVVFFTATSPLKKEKSARSGPNWQKRQVVPQKAGSDPILAKMPEKSQVGCNFGQLVETFRFSKAILALKRDNLAPGCRIR